MSAAPPGALSAAGTGAAGGAMLVSNLRVQPDTVFGVQWSAYMIFIVIIGGLGYLEGPLIGSLIFFARQRWLADYGVWYLVLLGAIAVAAAIWLPRGVWGVLSSRGVRLFGVGYHLQEPR